ncbi:MAG TPA: hypothetical protein VMJ10_09670 [Kofleriaceae bacterium]|nr:hypothetical protein [Kofleriaceae bacterium]
MKKLWIVALVAGIAATADAQPSDPYNHDAGGNGSAQAPPQEPQPPPPPQPGPEQPPPQQHTVRVLGRTRMYELPNEASAVMTYVEPNEQLVPVRTEGEWTYVENWRGQAGWIKTSRVAAAQAPASPDDAAAEEAKQEPPKKPEKPRPPDPPVDLPMLIAAPTGWLLPAAVLYSRTGLDTGGGFTSDNRVGLGDVAEFGVKTLDQVRSCSGPTTLSDCANSASAIQPYFTAIFRMGVGEDRLFDGQPGLVLGFEKSFERDDGDNATRIAELTLVASKKLGDRASIHVGAAFWDAEFTNSTSDTTVALHNLDGGFANQIRPFAGLAASPIAKSELLVDLSWAPQFCYACNTSGPTDNQQIRLRPELAWGVRYKVADWMLLESGVRVPDIGNANLLDAQIYGAVTFVTWGLRHAVDSVK